MEIFSLLAAPLIEWIAQEEHKAKATKAGYTEMAVFLLRNK